MREIDPRLSHRASNYWPGALVVKEVLRPGHELTADAFAETRWYLVHGDEDKVQLGSPIPPGSFTQSVAALNHLIRAHKATNKG